MSATDTFDAEDPSRWAWVEIDLDAIGHNIGVLRSAVSPAAVWAVVKADGYGHGAVRVAEQALAAGAEGLCVALVAEGVTLRNAGIDAPILVLSEQPPAQVSGMLEHRLTPTVYTVGFAEALAAHGGPTDVHVKIDTGMQRVGVPADAALDLMRALDHLAPTIRVVGVFTHLACADDPSSHATDGQLALFDAVLDEFEFAGVRPGVVHAANSAGALAFEGSRRSFVRAGIAIYGISPGHGVDHLTDRLRPAMSVHTRVSYVKRVAAGTHVAYGWRHRFEHDTTLATLPVGYADGVPRRLGTLADQPGADVMIGGRRRPIVGVVTMDQILVDVGEDDVAIGDPVVLIGSQGSESIRAEEWADRLGTIGYEVVCGISARMPRRAGVADGRTG